MKKTNVLKSAAIAAMFSLLALVGCNNAVDSEARSSSYIASGQIFGYVTDTKGEPLSGVTIALGDKTTKTNDAGAFALTDIPVNATETDTAGTISHATGTTQTYTLTAKKDGYLSSTLTGIVVVETTDKSDSALLLATAATAYQKILEEFAKAGGAGASAITSGSLVATDGVVLNSQNINDTYKGMANAYATLIEKYQNLSKTYESTFVTTALTPCNGWFEGSLKITKSPANDITTDADSIKAAPEGVKVKLVTTPATGFTSYVYEKTTDKDGKFKFENLPVETALTLKVEGFEATYESAGAKETYYYSLMDSTTASTAKFTYPGSDLQEDTLTIKLEEKSGAKYKADVLLYSQPAKIIVTETNLLKNTAVAPLALDTPVTVTFNKPMDYVELVTETGVTTVNEIGEKANYVFDESKKKVTITPKDGFWTASSDTVTFVISGRAQDGATSFIDNKFTVKLDNIIKVKFADVSDADKDAFTLTFDRELVKTDAVKVTDDKSEALTLSWNKENVSAPVLTVKARDGKFAKPGDHTFTISNVEAKDESNVLYSFDREFAVTTTPAYTFKVRFDGFKAVSIDVVEKADGSLSRSIVATTAQYLKITFNRNVSDASGLSLTDGTNAAKDKYVKDNAVYFSLADFEDNKTLTLSGSVISTSGEKFDGTGDVKWADLLTDYTVRTAYVIAASNLYVEKTSINENNDNTSTAIKSGEKVTLTFNKEIPANAVTETELYRSDSIVNMDQTPYKATATASGKVVTVTLSETIPGKTYYLSLKIKSADGAELFSTGSKSFARGTYVPNAYVESKIVYPAASSTGFALAKKYIEINVLKVKLLPEGSSKTTKAAEFKKSSNGSIVLQFNQDVTGYKAFLYNVYGYTYNTLQKARNALATDYVNLENAQKALFYGAKSTVDGDTITITPDYSFASNDNPGIAVYNADGEWVELGTIPNGGTTPAPYAPYYSKTYADKLAPENASTTDAFKVTPAKQSGYDQGDKAELTFKMLAANKYTNDLPVFTLYVKVKNGYGDDEWFNVGTQNFVKSSDKGTFLYKDFKVDNADAYIEVSAGAELTYGSEEFVLLTTINHMVISSNVIEITK